MTIVLLNNLILNNLHHKFSISLYCYAFFSILLEFSEDLGTLFRPIFEDFLGFKVDFNNPEVIDYDDSIVYETAKLNKMETVVTEKCGAFINLVMDEMEQPNYLSDESTIGAGIVLDEFRK